MKISISIICFYLLLATQMLLLSACYKDTKKNETVTITDMVGDVVEIPKNPQKVGVLLSRSAIDMLVAFGLGENITGIFETIFDNEWASVIYPDISNYASYNYSTTIETYLEHGVEMVFCPEKHLAENLREHGIPAVTVSQYGTPNYDNYVFYFADMITQIWDDKNVTNKVENWKNGFETIRSKIITTLSDVETTNTLYYVRGDRNRGIAYTENTAYSIQNTICRYLKLDYASKDFSTSQPTAEAILALDPDYIIIGGAFQNNIINEARTNDVWKNLSAFQNDKVYNIGVGFVMFEQNGVELTVYLADLANKIHPDKFNFNIVGLLKDIMQTYFRFELSDSDAHNMLHGLNRNGQPLAK
jgi:iron complex transport system substrate-binding protein